MATIFFLADLKELLELFRKLFTVSTYLALFSKYFDKKNERIARVPPSWIFTDMHAHVTRGVTLFFSFESDIVVSL